MFFKGDSFTKMFTPRKLSYYSRTSRLVYTELQNHFEASVLSLNVAKLEFALASVKCIYLKLHSDHTGELATVKWIYLKLHSDHMGELASVKCVYLKLHLDHTGELANVKCVCLKLHSDHTGELASVNSV